MDSVAKYLLMQLDHYGLACPAVKWGGGPQAVEQIQNVWRFMDSCFSERFGFVFCLPFIQTEVKKKKKDTLSGSQSEHKVCLDKGEALLLYNSLAGRASSPRKGESWA